MTRDAKHAPTRDRTMEKMLIVSWLFSKYYTVCKVFKEATMRQ